MILIAISYHGRGEKGTEGEAPAKFWNYAFSSQDIGRALKQWHFCSFAEKGRDLDPQDLLAARLNRTSRSRD